jgi:hypothetical protein
MRGRIEIRPRRFSLRPQSSMLHQRRMRFLLAPRKSQRQPVPAEIALVEGFRLPFYGAAGIAASGVVISVLLIGKKNPGG